MDIVDHFSKGCSVGKAQIGSQSREGMNGVCSITHKYDTGRDVLVSVLVDEGERRPTRGQRNRPKTILKCLGQRGRKSRIIKAVQFIEALW